MEQRAVIALVDRRIEFFDYLRALAIVLVVIAHHRLENSPGGSIGVSIFFCLSGFLITTLLLEEEAMTVAAVRRFIIRRWMRVYPAYFATLVLLLVIMVIKGNPKLADYLAALPGLALFASQPKEWLGMGVGVFWTLHVEFWFYVSMPLLMMLVGRGRALLAWALVFIGVSYILKFRIAALNGEIWSGSPLQFLLWADNLLYGSIVAMLARANWLRLPRWICWVLTVICIAGLEAIALYVPNTHRPFWLIESAAASLLTAVILAAFIMAPNYTRIAPLAWLGRISYSVYLLHAISIDYGWDLWPLQGPNIGRFAGATALILMLHYWVEKPGIRFGRRWTSRQPAPIPQRNPTPSS